MESAMRMRSWFSLIFAAIMGTLAPLTEVTEEEIGEAGGRGSTETGTLRSRLYTNCLSHTFSKALICNTMYV